MIITATMFSEGAKRAIALRINGKVNVIALSLAGDGWYLPTSLPYSENIDRFNRPIYHNDNLR